MTFHRVSFLELFQGKDQKFRIMLIRKWALEIRKCKLVFKNKLKNELTGKELVQTSDSQASCGVNGNSFFSANVRAILQVAVLSLLLSLEV